MSRCEDPILEFYFFFIQFRENNTNSMLPLHHFLSTLSFGKRRGPFFQAHSLEKPFLYPEYCEMSPDIRVSF